MEWFTEEAGESYLPRTELGGGHFSGDGIETETETVQAYHGHMAGSVPRHCSKANIAVKQVR